MSTTEITDTQRIEWLEKNVHLLERKQERLYKLAPTRDILNRIMEPKFRSHPFHGEFVTVRDAVDAAIRWDI